MRHKLHEYELLALSLAGAGFSGYLSAVKFFSTGCALSTPCPYFLGYPACYFGFAMFVLLALLSIALILEKRVESWLFGISLVGTLFALYFTYAEWYAVQHFFTTWVLRDIPSCAVGLLVYLAFLYFALCEWRLSRRTN